MVDGLVLLVLEGMAGIGVGVAGGLVGMAGVLVGMAGVLVGVGIGVRCGQMMSRGGVGSRVVVSGKSLAGVG